ncbi:MAG: hypothetical protein QOE22_319 [Candidatus Parcubacteria bacterium]|jgi:hypothetical protein|nr:hypothetical protein [Candidatus Parcubacteria bacterium]
MSNEVVFLEENPNTVGNIRIVQGAPKGILAWLVKNKTVQTAKQGERVLVVVAVIAIVLAIGIYVLFGMNRSAPPPYMPGIPSASGTLMPIPKP